MNYESITNTNHLISDFNQSIKEFNTRISLMKETYDSEYKKIIKLELDELFGKVTKTFNAFGKVTKYKNTIRLTFHKGYRNRFRSAYPFSTEINDEVGTSYIKTKGGGSNTYSEFKFIEFKFTDGYLKTKYNFPSWNVVTRKIKEIKL